MLQVMLCGAHDTISVRDSFASVIRDFGGEPWHYIDGQIEHLNSANSSWVENSLATVARADLCVFVLVAAYGEITWDTELREALRTGKPFVVMCLDRTKSRLETLSRDAVTITDGDQKLVDLLREITTARQLTIVTYASEFFGSTLRNALAGMFARTLKGLERRNQRRATHDLLTGGRGIPIAEIPRIREIAIDEFESKTVRKAAVMALADFGLDEDDVYVLLGSEEQGIQRLAVSLLPRLMRERPVPEDFLAECVRVSAQSDDVGLIRRLIPSLFRFGLEDALLALQEVGLDDVGVRRRIAGSLESLEAEVSPTTVSTVRAMLARCLATPNESTWKARAREFDERLRSAFAN